MDRNRIIKFLSCFIPLKTFRYAFRARFMTSIVKDNGKNNKFILLDDEGNELKTKYLKNLKINFNGDNNYIRMYVSTNFWNMKTITLSDDNVINIGKTIHRFNLSVSTLSKGAKLIVGNNVFVVQAFIALSDEPGLKVEIGDNCMLSHDIIIRTSDGHTLIDDKSGEILNYPKDIKIGNHCWLGMNTTVLKGADMPDNSVLAAGSIYTKSSNPKDKNLKGCIFAGAPAKVIKTGINWNRLNTYQYEKSYEKMAKTVDMTGKRSVGGGAPLIELYQAFPAQKVA